MFSWPDRIFSWSLRNPGTYKIYKNNLEVFKAREQKMEKISRINRWYPKSNLHSSDIRASRVTSTDPTESTFLHNLCKKHVSTYIYNVIPYLLNKKKCLQQSNFQAADSTFSDTFCIERLTGLVMGQFISMKKTFISASM